MGKHWPEIIRVNTGIATIPLFGVDIPLSSKGIRLFSEFPRVEVDNKIKLR